MYWLAMIPSMIVSWTPLHVFPDDYVDRAMSVVIRNNEVQIEYSAAMNDNTIRKVIQNWQADSDSSYQLATDYEDSERTEKPSAPPTLNAAKPLPNPRPSPSDDDEEDFKNDAELLRQLHALAAQQLANNLVVTYDGKTLELEPPSEIPTARYHMSVTVQYKLQLPDSANTGNKQKLFSIVDQNFKQLDGGVRYSLKATGNCLLTSSNVAPILVRADRIELSDLDADGRKKIHRIEAKIVQVGGGK